MTKTGGIVLIAVGVAVGTYAVWPHEDASAPELPPQVDVDIGNTASAPPPPPPQLPSFSAPVVVTLPRRRELPSAPARNTLPVPADRGSLTRELQKELKRVGCYYGQLNANWTSAARAAMKEFTERVNAKLPLNGPDPILLTLLRNYEDKVCGSPCPTGQTLTRDDRCLPNAILEATKKRNAVVAKGPTSNPATAIAGWTTATSAAVPTVDPAPRERMPLEGPTRRISTAASRPAKPRTAHASVTRRVTSATGGWASSIFRNNMSPN